MNIIMNIAVDCLGTIILLLMFFNFGSRDIRKRETDDILFQTMLLVNIGLLAADAFMWILDGTSFLGARALHTLVTAVYYLLQPTMCMIWILYCEYKLTENRQRMRKLLPICLLPWAVDTILIIVSCFTPFFFYIDENNRYSRQKYYLVFMLLCLVYYFYGIVLDIRARKVERKSKIKEITDFLLFYPVFPIIGGVIQFMFFGISIAWVGSVLSLLIIYFNLQNAKITSDPLTGINNRRRFESFMEYKLRNRRGKSVLYLLMIDVDHFKAINDKYGHLCGDRALKQTVALLIKAIKRQDFIARIGGDEFVVVGERDTEAEVLEAITAIKQEFKAFQETGSQPYVLSVSIGYSASNEEAAKSMDALLAEADERMYREKQ